MEYSFWGGVVFLIVCMSGLWTFLLGVARQSTGLVVIGLLLFTSPFLFIYCRRVSIWLLERRSLSSRADTEKPSKRRFREPFSGLMLATWFLGWLCVGGFGLSVSHIPMPLTFLGMAMFFGPIVLFGIGMVGFLFFTITSILMTSLWEKRVKKARAKPQGPSSAE